MSIILVLFLTSYLSAQSLIEGWDKAKFGMTPGELKSAYKGEEKYFKEKGVDFWEEWKENKFEHSPYTLGTFKLKILGGESQVRFAFVDNKLFWIEISGGVKIPGIMAGTLGMKRAIKQAQELKLKLVKLKDYLIRKYGNPVEKKESKEKETLRWEDAEGNTLTLEIQFEQEGYWGKDYYFPSYKVFYDDIELAKIWKRKISKWKNEEKRYEERGIESF